MVDDKTCFDPWRNLALEECLLDACGEQDAILYLWQNAQTVVIGRNQNPWRECRTELLELEGGRLARRITGGGAVFHDLGNLNFSFIAGKAVYDISRHLKVVLDAVRRVGVQAEFSGRNDILSEGRKFSGNAFAHRQSASLHHGTLLICADMGMLGRYLQPSQAKMASKGVQSVQSRVVNLSELSADATVENLRHALKESFQMEYGPYCQSDGFSMVGKELLEHLQARQQSWEWRFGQTPRFDVSLQCRFQWGGVEMELINRDGRVAEAKIFSDGMDAALFPMLAEALIGRSFSPAILAAALLSASDSAEAFDVAQWLEQCQF